MSFSSALNSRIQSDASYDFGEVISGFYVLAPLDLGGNSQGMMLTLGTDNLGVCRLTLHFQTTNTIQLENARVTTDGLWKAINQSLQTPALTDWKSVGFSYDMANVANVPALYVNGVRQTFQNSTQPVGAQSQTGAQPFMMAGASSGSPGTRHVSGAIAQGALWNRILSDAEHKRVHCCGVRSLLKGLLVHHQFSRLSGGAADLSGQGRNSTVTVATGTFDARVRGYVSTVGATIAA